MKIKTAISFSDFERHGCPKCGKKECTEELANGEYRINTCSSCGTTFCVCVDGLNETPFKVNGEKIAVKRHPLEK